jgi:hypothetical protein
VLPPHAASAMTAMLTVAGRFTEAERTRRYDRESRRKRGRL